MKKKTKKTKKKNTFVTAIILSGIFVAAETIQIGVAMFATAHGIHLIWGD